MRVHIPDPEYTASDRARTSFRLALKLALGFVVVVWLIDIANWALGLELQRHGIHPRELAGLAGIVFAPLLHGGPFHLAANTMPLLVLGAAMLHLYPSSALKVLPAIYFGPGVAVWLFGQEGTHVGSSGLIYGLLGYVFLAGVIRLDRRAIAASLLVAFLYGSMVWGVLPIQPGVSWQSHLAGAVIGLALAVALRRLDVPPRKRYSWEDEEGVSAEEGGEARDDSNSEDR
jgi:membrane associated rhomboid family serine protease